MIPVPLYSLAEKGSGGNGARGWSLQASTRSLYECGHHIEKFVLKDNYGWGRGGHPVKTFHRR